MSSAPHVRSDQEAVRRSALKPQLLNVSTSGTFLDGLIVERNRERANVDSHGGAVKASQHFLVVHSARPAHLEWRLHGACNNAQFSAGEVIVNPQGLFIAPRWRSEVEIVLLALDPGFVNRIADRLGRHASVELIPYIHFRDDLIRHLAVNLIAEFERDVPPDPVYVESLSHALVAHLVRHYSVAGLKTATPSGGLPPRVLARIVDYISDNLDAPITLEHLAGIAGLSPSHFIAMFKRSTGFAPHQYLTAQRVERARALLQNTRLPIAEIAARTGFADQSHLTRRLRQYTGLTPRLLRGA